MAKVIDSPFQQVPNGHGGPREIVRSEELLEPSKDALNDGVISGSSYPRHALCHMALLKEIGIAG